MNHDFPLFYTFAGSLHALRRCHEPDAFIVAMTDLTLTRLVYVKLNKAQSSITFAPTPDKNSPDQAISSGSIIDGDDDVNDDDDDDEVNDVGDDDGDGTATVIISDAEDDATHDEDILHEVQFSMPQNDML